MTTSDIADSQGGAGEQVASPLDATDKTPYLDPQTEHSVARVFNSDAASGDGNFPVYVYTNKVKASYIDMSKKRSTCTVTIQDEALVQIADYEYVPAVVSPPADAIPNYGIGKNTNVDGYDYIVILAETSKADIKIVGNYAGNSIVLFSGYNRGSYALDLDGLRVNTSYVGIEELLNEIKIDGILEVDHSNSATELLSGDITTKQVKYYNKKTIFNEKGMRDKYVGQLAYDVTTVDNDGEDIATGLEDIEVFDKSGLQTTKFWNAKDIFDYLVGIYIDLNYDIRNMLDQKDRITWVERFVRFDYGAIGRSDLADIIPLDFNITGMGLLDAIYKIIDESRRYSVSKKYQGDGVALVGMRANNKAQRTADNAGDIPLKLQIGEYQATAVKLDNVESANININRENKSVGRVVVRSGNLWINTICSTWGNNVQDPIDSNSKDSKSIAANTGFSGHLNLICSDYTDSKSGVPAQTYHIITSLALDVFLTDAGLTLADFNETTDFELFENEKLATIKGSLFLPYGNVGGRQFEDMQVYTAFMKKNTANATWSPVLEDGADRFHFIQPIVGGLDDTWKIAIKYNSKGFGSFIVYSNADKNDDGLSEHRFKEYIDNSEVTEANKYTVDRGVDTNEIPLYIRCAIKTDYRLRGVAELAGYDSYKHRTLYIDDKEVEFGIQYNDKTYDGSGGWTDLTDGFIDGTGTAEKQALANLQSKAEAILDKYTNVSNSGYVELNGCQYGVRVGDMIDEFEGTNRAFDFEAIINKIGYDLVERKTIVNFGAKFG